MILRRLSEGFRRQDWFVVGVEILTVVIGIFIGLQVDDWNEQRLERAHEQVVQERIFEESHEIISYLINETERRISSIERIEKGVVALQSALEGYAYSIESLSDLNRVSFFP
ncbi:MAG: hypothetical protein HUJ16_12490, partial [Kangiella sp.]|nr:hypothetical protein [Kangiella sp.]